MTTRAALFQAVRAFAPDKRFTDDHVKAIDALADSFGLARGDTGAPDPQLIAALKIDEGLRLNAYRDTVGVWTVGYGHAHVDPGTVWTRAMAEHVLIDDVRSHNAKLYARAPWIKDLDPVRRRVLENMAFNLGIDGLLGFKNTLRAVQDGRYDDAANGMLASKWSRQVKGRAVRLAQEMRTGRV